MTVIQASKLESKAARDWQRGLDMHFSLISLSRAHGIFYLRVKLSGFRGFQFLTYCDCCCWLNLRIKSVDLRI